MYPHDSAEAREVVSNVRCVNEEEFLKELPQIAYDVPMAINTDDCGDDIATCGEKLLSSGSVRDALNRRISEWTTQIEIIQDNIYTSLEDYNLMSYFEALQLSYVVLHIHRIT